jgi:glutathione S-transferase
MAYKLHYFQIRGRGEQVRLMLHALELPFDDILVKREQFLEMKAQGPGTLYFGSLPMLEDGVYRLCQGPTILSYLARKHGAAPNDLQLSARADAIAWGAEDLRMRYFKMFGDDRENARADFLNGDWLTRWLPSLNGLLGQNGNSGHFVGQQLSHADIAVWDVLDAFQAYVPPASLEGFPALQDFYEKVRGLPALAGYLASRSV